MYHTILGAKPCPKIVFRIYGNGTELAKVKMSINPFDEIAVEEAIRLKEAGKANEVIMVSLDVALCSETIRSALAIGADRSIHVQSDDDLQPLAVAKLVKAIVSQENRG